MDHQDTLMERTDSAAVEDSSQQQQSQQHVQTRKRDQKALLKQQQKLELSKRLSSTSHMIDEQDEEEIKISVEEPQVSAQAGKLHLKLEGSDAVIMHTSDEFLFVSTMVTETSGKMQTFVHMIERSTLQPFAKLKEDGWVRALTTVTRKQGHHFVVLSVRQNEGSHINKLKIFEKTPKTKGLVQVKIMHLYSPILTMHGLSLPYDLSWNTNGVPIVVCGSAKGKTAHLKIKVKQGKKSADENYQKYEFELQKFDFRNGNDTVQIVPSHSHNGLHLAFNQGRSRISIYDYTATCIPKDQRPESSFYFPTKIEYQNVTRELLVGQIQISGERIRIIKEVDAGIWLLYLEKQNSYRLFNIAMPNYLHKCVIQGIDATPSTVKLHPEFFMGCNQELLYVGKFGVIKHCQTRLVHLRDDD